MANDMERLLEELSAIRRHLAGIESAAGGYMHDRFWGKGTLLEQYQAEIDEQVLIWGIFNLPNPLEAIELRREAREKVRQEAIQRRRKKV
ncbi:hypothetical protein DN820_17580 [Stutzerimonas nosocomialis]|uniref:Uncharacterized protein n=1 Tax=Stutzerimonas nosocomialis TaxID=1056496 RepID=A0A5R9QBH1_9GAMM|nr:hypothetical protein [Stutzerimonas nosocomialis]TLX62142.1 hypothetical protein DN820_17580 [Stutzerimonas nosocomialis]